MVVAERDLEPAVLTKREPCDAVERQCQLVTQDPAPQIGVTTRSGQEPFAARLALEAEQRQSAAAQRQTRLTPGHEPELAAQRHGKARRDDRFYGRSIARSARAVRHLSSVTR